MDASVAFGTEGNQVLLGIVAGVANETPCSELQDSTWRRTLVTCPCFRSRKHTTTLFMALTGCL
jgi:hypothetical protein